ncbi:DNA-binding storekeeper protein-relatedtranscriptional regulator [Striga asiatica]|uniref:DNA-binding storekeeper protein-relatedtranscriptional regulator n=1 Tax=Striga asiatica TaxID=4170 RepID=A0A5A7R0H2_STRAF|nr:DNA-binding storekeeper protein-relatedtranscriptional regulator [Striga asiatica]
MSKSREPEKPVSSETFSGEEETDDSSSEEIESEPEPIRRSSPPPAAARKPHTPSGTKPAPPDEDSGSESESESDKKSRKNSTRKRAVEEVKGTEPTVTKKSKNSKEAEPEASEKKQLFQRIWSESDEIRLLNGIMQFRAEKKSDPHDNMDAFLAFIKKDLHIDVTKTQMRKKISRMKEKYTNNKRKEQEGKGRAFTSQHEQEAYDLSEKVWGAEKENRVEKANGSGPKKENRVEKANGSRAEKENMVEKANGSMAEKENGFEKANGSESDPNNIKDSMASERRFVQTKARLLSGLDENLPAVGDLKLEEGEMGVKEYEEAWKKLENEEMEVNVRYFEVMTQHSKLLLQIMKSRSH